MNWFVEVSVCRGFGLSTFRSVDVLVCRHFCLSTFWYVNVSVCRRFGLSTFRFVDVLVCRRFGVSTFRSVDVSVCRRFGCRRFGLSMFWPVTIPWTYKWWVTARPKRATFVVYFVSILENCIYICICCQSGCCPVIIWNKFESRQCTFMCRS